MSDVTNFTEGQTLDSSNMSPGLMEEVLGKPLTNQLSNVELNKAIEANPELLEKIASQEDPMDNPKVNEAAKIFMDSLPRVKALASNMKAGSLGRVFKGVIEFPLGEGYPRFRSKAENELFITTLSLLQAKNVMVGAIMKKEKMTQDAADAAIQSAAAAVAIDANLQPDLTVVESKLEETNG